MTETNLTLNNIIQEVNDLADGHEMLNDFKYGNFLQIYQSGKVEYKALLMNVNNATLTEKFITISLELMVMDKVFNDKTDENDVESETLSILGDIYSVINYSNRWQAFSKVTSASPLRKFISKGEDKVTGWVVEFSLQIQRENGICDLPIRNYDFEGELTPSCAGVRIFEDGILIKIVPSGGSFSFSTEGDPASILLNLAALVDVPAGQTKAMTIVDQDDNSVTVTTFTDTANVFKGKVTISSLD